MNCVVSCGTLERQRRRPSSGSEGGKEVPGDVPAAAAAKAAIGGGGKKSPEKPLGTQTSNCDGDLIGEQEEETIIKSFSGDVLVLLKLDPESGSRTKGIIRPVKNGFLQ